MKRTVGIYKNFTRSLLPLAGLFSGIAGMASPQAAEAQGWIWTFPTNLVSLTSGKRNNIFYVGQPVTFTLTGKSAVRYEVRDYWGNVVDQGPARATLAPKVTQPGWYKLYLHGTPVPATLGDSVGGTMFVIFRNKPGFPALPAPTTPGSTYNPGGDEIMRGVTGIGPQRHYVTDASQPDQAIAALEGDIALDEAYYLPYEGMRNRELLVAFPNGTQNLDGVKKIVAHFKDRVMYWEPRNEPNGGSNGTDFVNKELIPFYKTIKSVSPNLRVLGPGVVSVGPGMLGWIEDFLKAGGAKYIDGFSFHAYNSINGDFSLAQTSLDNLNALLAKYGADKIEKWQTEQGYFAAYYGAYAPRHQGRWTMAQMMAFEQYGIPKEHNNLWYDTSHGFWDMPCWTENNDGSLNPAGALMRVWSEELYGTTFNQKLNMGATGDKLFMGSLFQGPNKQVAVFMSAGGTDGQVTLNVTGGSSLHVVSAFGVEQDIPISNGYAVPNVSGRLIINGQITLNVPELPVYVEIADGQTVTVAPTDWGPNLALQPGVKVLASGSSAHPVWPTTDNSITKLVNDQLENWYYAQGTDGHPWMSNVSSFPATVEVDLPSKQEVNRVAIYCPVPWQLDGALLDYDLQYDNNGQWITIAGAKEPTNTLAAFTPTLRCTVDSFYSDRSIFTHTFAPVTTSKLRLYVRDATWGGGPVKAFNDAQGYTLPHQITIREIEVYSSYVAQQFTISGQVTDTNGQGISGLSVNLSGWRAMTIKTDARGYYSFKGLEAGRTYTVTARKDAMAIIPATQSTRYLYQDMQMNFRESNSFAALISIDTATQGNWIGVYGKEGYNIIGNAVKYPKNWQITSSKCSGWIWASSTTEIKALQKATNPSDRVAACWYSAPQFSIDYTPGDSQLHQVSLYLLDDDARSRIMRIDVLDASSGEIIDSQDARAFSNGKYLVWNVKGHVTFQLNNISVNGVLSGLFIDPASTTGK